MADLVRRPARPDWMPPIGAGATEVRVSRRVHAFEDSDLLELLTATLQREYVNDQGELELHLTRPGHRCAFPMNR